MEHVCVPMERKTRRFNGTAALYGLPMIAVDATSVYWMSTPGALTNPPTPGYDLMKLTPK